MPLHTHTACDLELCVLDFYRLLSHQIPRAVHGFIDGIKTSGFVLNKELADADVAEAESKRVLAEKMTAYQAARDDYHNKSETLKKVKAKYGIK